MGAIDQKLQADLVRQEGYMRMNEQKFQQQLMLQQARADALARATSQCPAPGFLTPWRWGNKSTVQFPSTRPKMSFTIPSEAAPKTNISAAYGEGNSSDGGFDYGAFPKEPNCGFS